MNKSLIMKSRTQRLRNRKTHTGILVVVTISLLTVCHVATGQTVEGVIAYETKMNMHRTLPKGREEMKNMIPEFRITSQELLFNAGESSYKHIEEDEDVEVGSAPVQMRIQHPFNEIYFDQ